MVKCRNPPNCLAFLFSIQYVRRLCCQIECDWDSTWLTDNHSRQLKRCKRGIHIIRQIAWSNLILAPEYALAGSVILFFSSGGVSFSGGVDGTGHGPTSPDFCDRL